MSDIIGKTIGEIREINPDVDELSERELCYIVSLGMGEQKCSRGSPISTDKYVIPKDAAKRSDVKADFSTPKYHASWEHAGRVLRALPPYQIRKDSRKDLIGIHPSPPHSSVRDPHWRFEIEVSIRSTPIKKGITKAAAKCIMAGIELEVSE